LTSNLFEYCPLNPNDSDMSNITHLKSVSQLNDILSKSTQKLTVIDFHATWCGPCHAIAPTFEQLSKQYTNANFLKCDVDEAKDVAALYKVAAMPTFIFLKGSNQVAQVKGANKSLLQSTVKEHAGSPSTAAFSGKGHTLGSSSTPASSSPENLNIAGSKGLAESWSNLDGNVKVFVGLLGAYILFWWLS